MRKTFLKVSLLAVLGLGMSASFTGCKDYDDDIKRLQEQYAQLKSEIDKINALVSSGSVITSVSQDASGVKFTLSNGQSYTVTNGKNGEKGQDADVWTIVTNAAGELVWAKNGVATEYPAQGPAGKPGENGTAEPGVYYEPNEDGYFYKVNPATGSSEKTPISWKTAAAEGSLSAVATGDKVILSGIIDGEGKPAEDVTIWRSMLVKSLVVMPELYLNGIEATRYDMVAAVQQKVTVPAGAKGEVATVVSGKNLTATVAAGEPASYKGKVNENNGKAVNWTTNVNSTLNYRLNPNDAAIPAADDWKLLFNDIEVATTSRSGNKGGIVSVEKNKAGDLTLTYNLTAGTIMPTQNANLTVDIDSAYTDKKGNVIPTVSRYLAANDADVNKTYFSPTFNEDLKVFVTGYKYRITIPWRSPEDAPTEGPNGQEVFSTTDKDGKVTGYYYLSDDVVYFNPAFINDGGKTTKTFYENAIYIASASNSWTFMALQANVEGGQVTSDNVALLQTNVDILDLCVDKVPTAATAVAAIAAPVTNSTKDKYGDKIPTVTLAAPYNEEFNLYKHLSVNISKLTPQVDNKASNNTQSSSNPNLDGTPTNFAEIPFKAGKQPYLSLAEVEAQYGLTPTYQIVKYHVGGYDTDENQFGTVNADGIVTPYYVNDNGQSVPVPATGAGRSAIGRSPMIYVTLIDAKGNIVLAGFVKVEWQDLGKGQNLAVVLGTATAPYICNWSITSSWEQISGKVYEALNMSPAQFESLLVKNPVTATPYVKVNDEFVPVNKLNDNYTPYQGTFSGFDALVGGTNTQGLTLTIKPAQYASWYPEKWNKNDGFTVQTYAAQQTVYARVELVTGYVYLGFDVTLVGAPAQDYNGKLASQWTADFQTAPINPAVPGQTGSSDKDAADATPVQVLTGYDYAAAMGMSFQSVWNGGVPVPNVAAPYNFTNDKGDNYIAKSTIKANYQFAATQNPSTITGVSGTLYTLAIAKTADGKKNNAQQLNAKWSVDGVDYIQPIAVITKGASGSNDVISILPFYQGNENAVNIPIDPTADAEVTYAQAACDIVNSQAFDKNNPAITFDVLMNVTYGECALTIPGSYDLEVGIGKPVAIAEEGSGSLQDAKNSSVLASRLFKMKDWQGNLLWNVSRAGVVTTNNFNGADLCDFWFSKGNFEVNNWEGPASLNINLGTALVGNENDVNKNIGYFNKVYVDKELAFKVTEGATLKDVEFTEDNLRAAVKDVTDLSNLNITWKNNGSAVTSPVYVFVPVSITYVWGDKLFLGYATITVQPTLSE